MGVRQPRVKRHEPNLGPVAHDQKYERDRHDCRVEMVAGAVEARPQQRPVGTQGGMGREIDQDRAKQRQCDPDTAQNEILPCRLKPRGRAIDTDEQRGAQSRALHGHPQNTDIVAGQRKQHGENKDLIHGVVSAQTRRVQMTQAHLGAHVGATEHRCGQGHECGQVHQKDVQGVHEQLMMPGRKRAVVQHAKGHDAGGDKGGAAYGDIEPKSRILAAQSTYQDGAH